MEGLQRSQLSKLCSNPETLKKAQSVLGLANAKTRPGSGFAVRNRAAIPAVCAYIASEQLNTGEVSLRSAMSAACVSHTEFADMLKKIGAALGTDECGASVNVTYETLVDAYRVHPREDAIACMEDTEAALPHVHILKENHGSNVLRCAIFYWVCQLMEEPSVQQRALCQAYSVDPKPFKAMVGLLDKQCDNVADQIKSYLLQKRSNVQASGSSQPSHTSRPTPASPQKSPVKSAMRPRTMTTTKISTPVATPSRKRTVAFTHLPSDGEDGASFPETPTKKRRINSVSPGKPSTSTPVKRSVAADTAAFYAAIQGGPSTHPVGQGSTMPALTPRADADPSSPRRPRHAKAVDVTTPVQASAQSTPSRAQQASSPTRPVRRRFRPVFLEQAQWCARDPKVERMWVVAERVFAEMVEMYGRPFERAEQCNGAVAA